MEDARREITGSEIQRFIELRTEEGKTEREALEALLKVIGGQMPEFHQNRPGAVPGRSA